MDTAMAWPMEEDEQSLLLCPPIAVPGTMHEASASMPRTKFITPPPSPPYAKHRQHSAILQFYEQNVLLAVR